MNNLFEIDKLVRQDLYRSYVMPELYPDERPAMVGNWSAEDREAYCGGEWTRGYGS
ncbi:hypothetical protein ACWEF6_01755 [Amycolatopsis sp. NPDC004772]